MSQVRKKLSGQKSKSKSPTRARALSSDPDEIPELNEAFWDNAMVGGPLRKKLMSLRLDGDVIEWFKSNGPNYQTKMNQVLRTYMLWMQKQEYEAKHNRLAKIDKKYGAAFKRLADR